MARIYPREYAKDFLKKAKKFLEIAKRTVEDYPEEGAFNAIQASINANDALTIWVLGKKASTDHGEAIFLHKEASSKIGESKIDLLTSELELRSATGYDIKKISKHDDCVVLVKKAERFVRWVEDIIIR
ncbi:MAG: hypothetical protein AB1779_03030 [Candidatus Thermoplasmatota archaeon]